LIPINNCIKKAPDVLRNKCLHATMSDHSPLLEVNWVHKK